MGRDSWQMASSDGGKTRRDVKVVRTNLDLGKRDLLAEVVKARAAFGLADDVPIHAVYEAGRDGFWFSRWLQAQGVHCLVVEPCSVLGDRKAKHRKNDAIDARALLDLLVRHVTGEREVHTVAVPSRDGEDARELGRLLHRLRAGAAWAGAAWAGAARAGAARAVGAVDPRHRRQLPHRYPG